jgi:CDP-diacylglycerol--glycerol-3-phosphate 3-phosphatidyltransferase
LNNPNADSSSLFARFAQWYHKIINGLIPSWISPNMMTLPRVPLAWLAVYFLAYGNYTLAFVFAFLVDVTDFVDGIIARMREQQSDFGKFFDPICDALGRWTLFFGLWHYSHIGHPSFILAIIFRDIAVAFLRQIAAAEGVVLSARPSGKLKAAIQWICTDIMFGLLILYGPNNTFWQMVNSVIMAVMTIMTMASLIEYYTANWHLVSDGFWDRKRNPPPT